MFTKCCISNFFEIHFVTLLPSKELETFCMKLMKLSIFKRISTSNTEKVREKLEKDCVNHALAMARIESDIADAPTAKVKLSLIEEFNNEKTALLQAADQIEALS